MNINFTDTCFLVTLVVLAVSGYARGLLRTIIGPIAFISATAGAFIAFKKTHNVLAAIGIGLCGPMILGWIINIILDNTFLRNRSTPAGAVSRLAGAAFNVLWGGLVFLSIIAMLVIIPLDSLGLGDINDNVKASATYRLFKRPLDSFGIIPPQEASRCASGICSMPPENQERLAQDKDINTLLNDPRVLKLISDPAMQAAIEKKDIGALLSNPAIFELGQDPAFIAKALRAYPKIRDASNR